LARQKRRADRVKWSARQIVNAVLYLVFTGCQWRFLPSDFPKWQTVYYYFAKWRKDGTWYRIHETLRWQKRIRHGRNKHPSAGCADSQSVKTTAVPSSRGFDGGKKINGRKRHILVDTRGFDDRLDHPRQLVSKTATD